MRVKNYVNKWFKEKQPRYAGLIGGVLFFCLSLTPSLLPRTSVIQGIASGITFAIGYGFGSLAGNILRPLTKKYLKSYTYNRRLITHLALGALTAFFLIKGYEWQNEIRVITNSQKADFFEPIVIVIVTFFVAYLLIGMSRKILKLSRRMAKKIAKRTSPKTARRLGAVTTAILLILFVDGIVFRTAMAVSNTLFGYQNTGTSEGIVRQEIPETSGGNGSYITWESLGKAGRDFIGKISKQTDIAKFTGREAQQPIRIYAGLKSAKDQKGQVDLIIQELERTHASERDVILVANSTGSGGINPRAAASVEYMSGGSSATVGMQYSYLPSWISFLADKDKAQEAGKTLFNATYDWWNKLDPATRPKLVVYGESLGSYGASGAFSGPADMANRTDGAVFVGTPNSSELWQDIVSDRDSGTPMWQPMYKDGEMIRFADYPSDLTKLSSTWSEPRVAYFQHASDPVVWWSPNLILHKPDWLKEPRGNDVIPATHWYPFVTFWQVVIDLPLAYGVPDGHGHKYDLKVAEGWANVLHPPDWTSEDTARLNEIL
jgi:uncharacterized membrane protein